MTMLMKEGGGRTLFIAKRKAKSNSTKLKTEGSKRIISTLRTRRGQKKLTRKGI